MTDSQLNLGLMRHGGGESGGSVQYYFSSLREQLESRFHLHLLPGYYYQLTRPAIKGLMRRFLPDLDVLYATNGKLIDYVICPFFIRNKLDLDLPIVYQPLGEFPRGAAGFRAVYKYFREQDEIVFSSSADQAIYHNLFTQMPCGDRVLPFGIDTRHFSKRSADEASQLKADLEIDPDAVVLLYVGRITSEKNLQALLDVFRQVNEVCPESYLLIVGNISDVRFHEFGTGPHDLKKCFRRMLVGDYARNVRFFGGAGRDDLPLFYSMADIFVNLTLHHDENFGYTQVEAMACGLPVVASAWGGLKDTVDASVGASIPVHLTGHGARVDRGIAASALISLIQEPDRRQALGLSARRRVEDRYSIEGHAGAMQDVFTEVTEREATQTSPMTGQPTELGARLLQRADLLRAGKVETLFDLNDDVMDLYQQLILPYTGAGAELFPATVDSSSSPVLSLASPLTELHGHDLHISDPLWPLTLADLSVGQQRAVSYIGSTGRISQADVLSDIEGLELNQLEALIESGVLLASRS